MFNKTVTAIKEGYKAYRAVQYSEKFKKWISGIGETTSGATVNEDTVYGLSTVYSCVNIVSQTVGSLPLKIYKRNGENREPAPDHYLYDILHNKPNPYMIPSSFKETLQAHVLTWGNGYAEIERDQLGRPLYLWPIHASRVAPLLIKGEMFYDICIAGGNVRRLTASQIFHIPGLSFDGISGTTPIQKSREAFGQALAAQEYGSRYFKNDANPGGTLAAPGKLDDDVYKRLQKSIRDGHEGLGNKHRFMLLEEGLKWEKVGLSPEDSQMLETMKFSGTQICGMFRVPPHMVGLLDRATFCLPADVEIMTETGPKSISLIQKGERVWSFGPDGAILSPVLHSICSGDDEVLEIRTTNRTLRCNSAHRVLCRRKYPNPKSGQGGYQSVKWRTEFISAGDLKVGDTIVTMGNLPEIGKNTAPNKRNLTEGFMSFCGLLMGDGNAYPGRGVTIARDKNARYMDAYRKIIKQEFVSYDGGNGRGKQNQVPKRPVHLCEGERQTRFSSVLAAKELIDLGFGGNARTKRVPYWVFGLNADLRLAFLRGFMDADGSVDKKGRASFASVNFEMLSQLRHLCMGLAIPVTNIRCQRGVVRLPNGKPFYSECFSFTCSNPAENLRIGSHDSIDCARLKNGKPFNRKSRRYPRYGGKGFDAVGCDLSRVSSIKKTKSEPVYDLEVADTHNFIANGVVVHNSNIEQQSLEFWTGGIYPWTKKWEETIGLRLIMESERKTFYSEFVSEGYLRGDIAARTAYYASALQNGYMSVNDVRRKENMNPVAGGDKYFRQLNLTTIDAPAPAIQGAK